MLERQIVTETQTLIGNCKYVTASLASRNVSMSNAPSAAKSLTSGQRILLKGRIVILTPLAAANGFARP